MKKIGIFTKATERNEKYTPYGSRDLIVDYMDAKLEDVLDQNLSKMLFMHETIKSQIKLYEAQEDFEPANADPEEILVGWQWVKQYALLKEIINLTEKHKNTKIFLIDGIIQDKETESKFYIFEGVIFTPWRDATLEISDYYFSGKIFTEEGEKEVESEDVLINAAQLEEFFPEAKYSAQIKMSYKRKNRESVKVTQFLKALMEMDSDKK